MKSVAIVGGGPSGLVAAKMLLHTSMAEIPNITLLEKQDRVGGLWAIDEHTTDRFLDPQMPTNLSRFTVSFSDLAWNSVDLSSATNKSNKNSNHIPMFPKAWQVQRYLQKYADKFIPKNIMQFNSEVLSAESIKTGDRSLWKLRWRKKREKKNGNNQVQSNDQEDHFEGLFDYLIIASGFYSERRDIPCTIEYKQGIKTTEKSPKLIHSSSLRNLSDVVQSDWNGNDSILVIGGGMSGVEAAASLAFQISSHQFSPGPNNFSNANIIHVTPKAFYNLPTILPIISDFKKQRGFIPLDLNFYDLSRRPPGPITAGLGKVAPERSQKGHQYFRSIICDDQSDLNAPPLVSTSTEYPPHVAISSSYSEFVRSKSIIPMAGRLLKLKETVAEGSKYSETNGQNSSLKTCLSATLSNSSDKNQQLNNIAGVVFANGYSPIPAISFLSSSVKDALDYQSQNCRIPILLENIQTGSNKMENIGFVGFYEAPYWGVMEMQARKLVHDWFLKDSNSKYVNVQNKDNDDIEKLKELRSGIQDGDLSIPQLLFDYVGIMEQTANELGLERDDTKLGEKNGPVLPARYTDKNSDKEEADKTMSDLKNTIEELRTKGRYVARAAFQALQGSWRLQRQLKSAIPTFPSGKFTGEANFHPRIPTDSKFDSEYLYVENGELITEQGFTMKANRRYAYRYREEDDKISVWFVKDDGKTIDYLFHDLELQIEQDGSQMNMWIAKARHPCEADMYNTTYEFDFHGIAIHSLKVKHEVSGPKKDYVSDSLYTRWGK